MGFASFLRTSRKLGRVGRWANEYMTDDVRPTVAGHLFTTSQIAQMLGKIEEQYGNEINWKELYEKVLNHDFIEAITGDVLSHVKNDNQEIKEMIVSIEKKLAEEKIFNKLPQEYVEEYKKILFNGKDSTIEGKILKAADTIDLLIECILELERGNPEEVFYDNYINAIKKLKTIDLQSVRYFINETLLEFLTNLPKIKKMTNELLK